MGVMAMDRREAEFVHEREAAVLLIEQDWRDGLIGDATLVRSLMILGVPDRDARWRLSYLIMERNRKCASNR